MDDPALDPQQPLLLSSYRLLHLQGEDAARFFQGYGTCDTRALDGTQARLGALCNRQGQAIANFLCWGTQSALTIRLHNTLQDAVERLLSPYLRLARSTLTPGLERGLALPPSLGTHAPTLPPGSQHSAGSDLTWIQPPRGDLELWGPDRAVRAWCEREGLTPASEQAWEARNLAQGHLYLRAEHSAQDVPQGFNLDQLGYIDFKKGCYLGQEIVARLHYRGEPKRRLYVARGGQAANPGDAVLDQTDQAMGAVLASARGPGDTYLALQLSPKRLERAQLPLKTAAGALHLLP